MSIKVDQKRLDNGMLSNTWTISKDDGSSGHGPGSSGHGPGSRILFNIPKCHSVYDYNPAYNNITITCNEFVIKRINEITKQICDLTGIEHINCLKDFKSTKQMNLRLTDLANRPYYSQIVDLKRGDAIEVEFECKQVSFVNKKYYLTMFLTDFKKLWPMAEKL